MHQLFTQLERGKITLQRPKGAVILDQRKPTQRNVYLGTLPRLVQGSSSIPEVCQAQLLGQKEGQSLWSRMTPYTSYFSFFPTRITAW